MSSILSECLADLLNDAYSDTQSEKIETKR